MTIRQDGRLLQRILTKLSPDLFSHPLWVYFADADFTSGEEIIQRLRAALQELEREVDQQAGPQILLGLAALEVRRGDLNAALACVEDAKKMVEFWNLATDSTWNLWAASALHAQMGNFHTSADYLDLLQSGLYRQDEWVAANVVATIRQSVLDLAQIAGRPDGHAELAQNLASVPEPALAALFSWGKSGMPELPPGQETGREQRSRYLDRGWEAISQFFVRTRKLVWNPMKSLMIGEPHLSRRRASSSGGLDLRLEDDLPLSAMLPAPRLKVEDVSAPNQPPDAGRLLSLQPIVEKRVGNRGDILVTSRTGPLMTIHCLGPFRVYLDNRYVDNWSSLRGQAILKYLVNQQGSIVPKDVLKEIFWPDADPEAARRNLHQAIYALRQTLKGAFPNVDYIEFINEGYRLNPAIDLWLDCAAFEQHALDGRRFEKHHRLEEAIAQYGIGEGLYKGSFMADDLYEEWPRPRREYLWQMYLDVVIRLCEYYLERREYTTTISLSQRILSQDNCQEAAYKFLILCYLAQGQRQLAHRQYQLCTEILKKELDLQPSPEIKALYRQIIG